MSVSSRKRVPNDRKSGNNRKIGHSLVVNTKGSETGGAGSNPGLGNFLLIGRLDLGALGYFWPVCPRSINLP